MLEIFDQSPQSRVFHVDRECYIVYLGSHWEDYKPFLRLGTSTSLPAELPPIVSTIVVPDVLTGNPLDEPACLVGDAAPDTHYVGDVETVEHMKSFVGANTIRVEAIEEIDHEEDDGKHVLVYYYGDGNLKIKFRKNEVFDLRRREKLDAHFVAHAQEAKNEYGRSPFKLPGDSYQRPGFLVLEGTAYLVARGELAALRLTDDYFFELSAAGVDADRIATVQAEDADRALIRFFKRSRTRNRPVRVSTPRKERIEEAADLFPQNSLPALKASVADGGGGAFDFHRFSVSQAPGRFEATIEDLEGPIVFGSAAKKTSDAPIMVDHTAGTLSLSGRKGALPLVDGTLYQIGEGKLTRTVLDETFLPQKNYEYRDLLSQSENALIGQLQYFFTELFGGRDTGKVLRTIRGLDSAKAIGKADGALHPVMQVILHNYKEYARYVEAHETEASRGAGTLVSLLERHELTRADVPPMLPLVGEIRRENAEVYLLYRFGSRITSDRFAHAERVVEKIRALPIIDFEAERSRLADLISGLATPEQMDEARMRRIAEAKAKQPQKAAADKKEKAAASASASGADGDDGAQDRGAAADRRTTRDARGSATGRRSSRSGGRRWILPAAAVVLLLIALFALLATGTITNPWFGDETQIAGRDEAGGDGVTANGSADAGGTDGANGTDNGDATSGTDTAAGTDTTDEDATADGTEPTDRDGAADDTAASEADAGAEEPRLPEGWPADSLPAIRALENTPGVTIMRDRVIGPGGIEITLRDIIELVNRIATENGYARMDAVDPERPNPDWIYPGNVFVLPNETRYTVVGGDTLWEITVRFMVARLRQDFERYTELVSEYEAEGTSDSRKREIAETLEVIGRESHTENFSRLVEEKLNQWGE